MISNQCVHGAIFIRDHIRSKDKDPTFSAKQFRMRVLELKIPECAYLCIGALASFRRLERMTASHRLANGSP
jgi:hypothetical protein